MISLAAAAKLSNEITAVAVKRRSFSRADPVYIGPTLEVAMSIVYNLSAKDPKQIHARGAKRTEAGIEIDVGPGDPEAVLHGPYYPLKKGDYEGTIRFDPAVPVTVSGHFDVVCDQASLALVKRQYSAQEINDGGFEIKLAFSVPHDVFDFEIRLFAGQGSRGKNYRGGNPRAWPSD